MVNKNGRSICPYCGKPQPAGKVHPDCRRKAANLFLDRYNAERDSLGLGDTLWGAFNAMTGFLQHDKTASGTDDADRVARRMESNLFGLNANRTHDVLAGALALSV